MKIQELNDGYKGSITVLITNLNRGVTAKVATFTDSFDGMKGLAFPVSGYVVTGSMMFQSDGTITATGGLENLGAGVTISFATSIFK